MMNTPMDVTTIESSDGGSLFGRGDAGGCQQTISGCTYSEVCLSQLGDAGSSEGSGIITINADGSITGSEKAVVSFSQAGISIMENCTWNIIGTKQ